MDTAITLTVVMITWVFAYVQTHQIVHIKYVQLFMYQLYLNKAINNVHWVGEILVLLLIAAAAVVKRRKSRI